jgi:hypothetical protein
MGVSQSSAQNSNFFVTAGRVAHAFKHVQAGHPEGVVQPLRLTEVILDRLPRPSDCLWFEPLSGHSSVRAKAAETESVTVSSCRKDARRVDSGAQVRCSGIGFASRTVR